MKIYVVTQILLAYLAIVLLTGCGGSTGWRFEFGVSPVKELSNTAGIKQEVEHGKKY